MGDWTYSYLAIAMKLAWEKDFAAAGLRGGDDPTGGLRGLLLIHIIYGLPITTLIFRNYFVGLPNSLIESAQVDRAGMLRTFVEVAIPLARPAFIVSIIWQFTAVWNDFLFGAVMTQSGRLAGHRRTEQHRRRPVRTLR